MADPAEQVTLKLTFWHGTKQPGDTVQVRRDELPAWRGFAVPVEDKPETNADDTANVAKAPTKTATGKQA